jgi:hypothetical protein
MLEMQSGITRRPMKGKMVVQMVLLMRVNSLSIAFTTAAAEMFWKSRKKHIVFLDVNADIMLRVIKMNFNKNMTWQNLIRPSRNVELINLTKWVDSLMQMFNKNCSFPFRWTWWDLMVGLGSGGMPLSWRTQMHFKCLEMKVLHLIWGR